MHFGRGFVGQNAYLAKAVRSKIRQGLNDAFLKLKKGLENLSENVPLDVY